MATRAGIVTGGAVVAGLAMVVSYSPQNVGVWLPDLIVGLAFVALSAFAIPHARGTSVLAGIGALAWIAGTILPTAHFWHRGVLIHLLLCTPWVWPRRRSARVAIVAGYLSCATPYPWSSDTAGIVTAVGFAGVVAVVRHPSTAALRAWPLTGAALFALVIGVGSVWRATAPGATGVIPGFWVYCLGVVGAIAALGAVQPRRPVVIATDLIVELGDAPGGDVGHALRRALDGTVIDESLLSVAVTRASSLAAANTALNREISTRVADVERSRRRLLLAGDEERRALRSELQSVVSEPLSRLARSIIAISQSDVADSPALARARSLVARAQGEIDEIGRGLHPSDLEDGLAVALESLAARSPVPVHLTVDRRRFAPELEAAVYYVCAEALANSLRHASSTEIRLQVEHRRGRLEIKASDNGAGGADLASGTGIRGLVDRIEALGGTTEVSSPRDRGTVVSVTLPLTDAAEPAPDAFIAGVSA
ncbi:MAG: hypothetical protein LH605_07655 [Microbacteriaceae bacterium]|nr:hypothetical protein [Microbacteriaceae bacterium]